MNRPGLLRPASRTAEKLICAVSPVSRFNSSMGLNNYTIEHINLC